METINSMAVCLKQGSPRGKFAWLTLRTGQENRECCYQRYADGKFFWVEGDNEPDMSAELKKLWEKDGDRYINACLETRQPQVVGSVSNMVTFEQIGLLESACAKYAEGMEDEPEEPFWTLCLCGEEGDGDVPESEACSVLFEVYDLDGQHDFDWLDSMLHEAGISVDKKLLGHEPFTDLVTGDGEYRPNYATIQCRIYGYQLALKK
jgi:hypothetical protein